MRVYTVHEPPLRAADAFADPASFAFVRDGFSVWAFLLTPFWMIRYRLWLALAIYLVGSALLETALRLAGAPAIVVALVAVLISLLVGLEAATLRRQKLRRQRWRDLGFVRADNLADAERRFFAAWVRRPESKPPQPARPPAAPSLPSAPLPGRTEPSGIIGLFPEPGAQR